jgi:hypothetical protein
MGMKTVQAEIARLEEIGRQRELSDSESVRLQKMITTERRYQTGTRRLAAKAVLA